MFIELNGSIVIATRILNKIRPKISKCSQTLPPDSQTPAAACSAALRAHHSLPPQIVGTPLPHHHDDVTFNTPLTVLSSED
jgi:hypothetical protein